MEYYKIVCIKYISIFLSVCDAEQEDFKIVRYDFITFSGSFRALYAYLCQTWIAALMRFTQQQPDPAHDSSLKQLLQENV